MLMVTSAKMMEWTREEVFKWLQTECKLPEEQAQKFFTSEINGEALQYLKKKDLMDSPLELSLGAAMIILEHVQKFTGQILSDCRHEHPNL